jgi:hypothetical protein
MALDELVYPCIHSTHGNGVICKISPSKGELTYAAVCRGGETIAARRERGHGVSRWQTALGQDVDGCCTRTANHAMGGVSLRIDKQDMDRQQRAGEGVRRSGGFHP